MEGGVQKMTPPFFGSKIMNLLVFFPDFEPKSVSGSRHHGVCMGQSGTSAHAVYALFSHFCLLAVLATSVTHATHSEGCEWGCCDNICLLGYERTFFLSPALPRAVQNLCQRREKPVPTNNGSHEFLGRCTTCWCSFSPWAAEKWKSRNLLF